MKEYPGEHFKRSLFVFDNRLTTDVVENTKKKIIGECFSCKVKSETYYSNDRIRPSKKVLCCPECYQINKSYLREGVTVL